MIHALLDAIGFQVHPGSWLYAFSACATFIIFAVRMAHYWPIWDTNKRGDAMWVALMSSAFWGLIAIVAIVYGISYSIGFVFSRTVRLFWPPPKPLVVPTLDVYDRLAQAEVERIAAPSTLRCSHCSVRVDNEHFDAGTRCADCRRGVYMEDIR